MKAINLILVGTMLLVDPIVVLSQGNLLITPRRVVFEGPKKSQELNLANTGKDTSTYSISVIQYRMKEDGSFEQITEPDPGQRFASPYIRFFPRTVTLGPNESQVVKMQLNKTGELTPGEYRSHIYFRAVPDQVPLGEEMESIDTGSISVRISPVFGITIPVIIRVGDRDAGVSLDDLSLIPVNDTVRKLSMTFHRTGEMSVYGDIEVSFIPENGEKLLLGMVKGLAVYTPNRVRKFQMDLFVPQEIILHKGVLKVTYLEASDDQPSKLAEATLPLP